MRQIANINLSSGKLIMRNTARRSQVREHRRFFKLPCYFFSLLVYLWIYFVFTLQNSLWKLPLTAMCLSCPRVSWPAVHFLLILPTALLRKCVLKHTAVEISERLVMSQRAQILMRCLFNDTSPCLVDPSFQTCGRSNKVFYQAVVNTGLNMLYSRDL